MLNIITSEREHELKSAVLSDICKKIGHDGAKRIFLLVPETLSHEAERALCLAAGNSVNLYAEVITFRRLANRISGEVGGLADTVIDDGGRILMIKRALDRCSGMLEHFACGSKKTDMLRSLAALCSELKQNGIAAERLAAAAQDPDCDFSKKLYDVSLIYSAYCAELGSSTIDPSDMNSLLAERIEYSRIIENSEIYFIGYSGFTPPEYRVISQMLAKTDLHVYLSFSDSSADPLGIFEKERQTIRRLRHAAAKAGAPVSVKSLADRSDALARRESFKSVSESLLRLAESFMHGTPEPFCGPCPELTLFAADSAYAECEFCAAQIKRLVREKNLRYRDFAVAARLPDKYSSTLCSVFEKYGVPIFLSGGSDILCAPPFVFVLSALEFFADLSRDSLISMMKSGFCGICAENISAFETYSEFWDIKGTALLDGGFKFNPDGYRRQMSDDECAQLELINSSYAPVCAVLREFYPKFKSAHTVNEFIACLYDFYTAFGAEQTLSDKISALSASGQNRLAAQYSQIQNVFVSALTQLERISGSDRVSLSEFHELLGLTLGSYSVDTIPVMLDCATFTSMDNMSFFDRPYLFILGASDGLMPYSARRDGIFSEAERESLIGMDIEFGQSSAELSDYELGIVYKSMTSARRALFVSYPKYSADGAETRPSFLFRRLQRAFPNHNAPDGGVIARECKSESAAAYFELACLALSDSDSRPAQRALRILSGMPEFAGRLGSVEKKAAAPDMTVSGDSLKFLCGEKLTLSPSRIERYSSCNFSYFMRYGLGIKTPQKKPFDYPDIGNFVHYILENALREIFEFGNGAANIDDSQLDRIISRLCSDYICEVLGGTEDKPARFKYIFGRLCRGVRLIVKNSIDELERSLFSPISFENAGAYYTLNVDGRQVKIGGRPDRIDAYSHDGALYLRVIDYKTGAKKFNLSDIQYGLNMQMLIYLFAGVKSAEARGAKPAGILYVPAREPFISEIPSSDDPDARSSAICGELKRSGLVLDQPEIIDAMEREIDGNAKFIPIGFKKDGTPSAASQLATTEDFSNIYACTDKVLRRIIGQMQRGRVDINPYFTASGSKNACEYCDFRLACLFDDTTDKNPSRRIRGCRRNEFLHRLSLERNK